MSSLYPRNMFVILVFSRNQPFNKFVWTCIQKNKFDYFHSRKYHTTKLAISMPSSTGVARGVGLFSATRCPHFACGLGPGRAATTYVGALPTAKFKGGNI